jgi:hypothetical protein
MTVETRYMRSDTAGINSYYNLLTSNTVTAVSKTLSFASLGVANIGIKVKKRDAGGTETQIGSGYITLGVVAMLEYDVNWNCPLTSLASTDRIKVEVYGQKDDFTYSLLASFITEQLGASQLDAATWTFHIWASCLWSDPLECYRIVFSFGSAARNSRITNFTWTPYVPPQGEFFVQVI